MKPRRQFLDGRPARHVTQLLALDHLTKLDQLAAKQVRNRSDLIREGVRLVIARYGDPNPAPISTPDKQYRPGSVPGGGERGL